jgi:rubrerythrin
VHSRADQLQVIGLMAAHETAIADLYLACAKSFPQLADFFESLAATEQEHARSITSFATRVRAGLARIPPGRLDPQEILASLDHVQELLKQISRAAIPLDDALSKCMELEETLLEKHCFDIIESDDPDLKQLLQKLSAETAEHRDELRKAQAGEPESAP